MTERKLASVRKIEDITPIPNADAIEAATIGGWKVVVKKGEFNIGDLVIYLEIDSWVPDTIAPFLSKGKVPRVYNGVPGERLKTIRLRGQISQGLILPLSVADGIIASPPFEGLDVTFPLNIQKWEADIPAQLRGLMRGSFPSWGRKTDQERAQNLTRQIKDAYDNDILFEVTIKLDGSSMSVGYSPEKEYTVCSRNINLKTDQEGNSFVDMAKNYNMEEKLTAHDQPIFISGELIGQGLNGNHEKLDYQDWYIFDIFDPILGDYVPAETRYELVQKFGLKHVPILHKSVTLKELGLATIDDLLKYAEGESLFVKKREGLVFKSVDGKHSFKIISNSYLLEKGN
jgi:RNA ligase (TIGR02306 family)